MNLLTANFMTKEPTKTHVAKATCKACKEVMTSNHGGHFVACACGKSFLDQERWDGRYARLGGEADFIGQICPENCKVHSDDKAL